jgi:beta-lactamase regulating signal transducer with metallopeptidase domain
MRISSQLLLTFLLNACWQIPLIAGLAALGAKLLGTSTARYRHLLWVGALFLSLLVPLVTTMRMSTELVLTSSTTVNTDAPGLAAPLLFNNKFAPTSTATSQWWSFQLSRSLALSLLVLYCLFLIFRAIKLAKAWYTTRAIRRSAVEIGPNEEIAQTVEKCGTAIPMNSRPVSVLRSETVPVPVTIGLTQPVIILPGELLREGNSELITSAIGHEFVHIARRDYVLNLIYEVLYLPISFNPAAALIRRRIKQTRELFCDEMVAERILSPEVYARSLVKLASSAPPLRRLSLTTTVGIADADILEARIMSLLKRPTKNPRSRRLLLFAAAVLLIVPCVAAASFAMRFDVETNAQEPVQQEKEATEKRLEMLKRAAADEDDLKRAITNDLQLAQQEKESTEKRLEMLKRSSANEEEFKRAIANDPQLRGELEERQRHQAIELEMKSLMQATLVKLARVPMDQAIQIATSQSPGKVLQCSLVGEHWEAPGKLAKDGQVLYHVVVLPENTTDGVIIHVLVNAIDGTILRTEKELPRKMRSPQP